VTREADGGLSFLTPHGRSLPAVPPSATVGLDPVSDMRTQNSALGLHIDAQTSTPRWLGERLDLDYAIAVLHPLACRPSVVS
jgi:hypothetical protein